MICVLVASTLLSLNLSRGVLEKRAQEDALLLSRLAALHVATVLHSARPEELTEHLRWLRDGHRPTAVIDVFLFANAETGELSSQGDIPPAPLSAEEHQAMRQGHFRSALGTWRGEQVVDVTSPISANGAVMGAVRVRLLLPGMQRLWTGGAYAAASLALVSSLGFFFCLSLFLGRQVSRPLVQLETAMRTAEAGNLQTRAYLRHDGEVGQLATHFNRMLARIERTDTENRALVARLNRFNDELERRVAQATRALATRNAELLRLQRELGRVEPLAALGRITATLAHELGTPLNSILGYTQLLARENLSEPIRRRLGTIEAQVRRMTDTLHYYLARTRGAPQAYQAVDVNALVRDTLMLLEPSFHQRRVQVVPVLTEVLPPLQADGSSLQRVLINLLNNAVDALEAGGTVTVTTREAGPPEIPQPSIVLEVTDTGPGIAPEILPKMFSLFATTKSPEKGSGLGLAISQEIVQAHGGIITITSRRGEGTCVRVFLPIGERVRHPLSPQERNYERTHSSD
jgi:signal transduction histidine kinase